MYHALLANRYLTSRVIPLVAVAAVALCVALVIIVVSVMSGFLEEVRSSGRKLVGDVVISAPIGYIPDPDALVAELEADPMVAAACPVVDGIGVLQMPYPERGPKETVPVYFWGVDPERYAAVSGYLDTIQWRAPNPENPSDAEGTAYYQRLVNDERIGPEGLALRERLAATLETPPWADVPDDGIRRGVVLGLHVSNLNRRTADGSIAAFGDWWMPREELTLVTLPAIAGPSPEPVRLRLGVVNEARSGIFIIDDHRIFISIEAAQQVLGVDRQPITEVDEFGIPVTGADGLPVVRAIDPPRATQVLVRAAPGVTPEELRPRVAALHDAWAVRWNDARPSALIELGVQARLSAAGTSVQTWEEQQAGFIGPIENERELMRTLFSMIYLVCAGLVLAIFWAIVHEKTRDIGILRAVGASRIGIAMIFVRYGLFIGIFGAIAGLGLGALVVGNINAIHDALGDPPVWLGVTFAVLALSCLVWTLALLRGRRLLPLVLGSLGTLVLGGLAVLVFTVSFTIWNAETYYFEEIPSRMDRFTAITTMAGAVVFSVLGAFFPAARAADVDPVRALRYE